MQTINDALKTKHMQTDAVLTMVCVRRCRCAWATEILNSHSIRTLECMHPCGICMTRMKHWNTLQKMVCTNNNYTCTFMYNNEVQNFRGGNDY